MTKKSKILTLALAGLTAIGMLGFVACNGEEETGAKTNEILIGGFESYDELTQMSWINSFGAVELTTEHKTQGDHAAKLTVRGLHTSSSKPQMIIPTDTDFVEKTDYTDVESVLVDVYNDSDTDQKIGFQYLTTADEKRVLSAEIFQTIPAKTTKTLEYKIDRDITAQFLNLDLVTSLRLTFENQKTYHEPNRVFYVDNMRVKTTDAPIDTSVPVRAEGEYESCDRPEYLSVWANILPKVYSDSTLSFNDDSAYIKSGNGSFKLTSNYSGGSATANHSVGFRLVKSDYTDLSDYYSLSFWVYNDNEVDTNFHINNMFVPQNPLKAKEWTQIELTVDWLKTQGLDVNSFLPAFVFHAHLDKPYTWYVDDIRLNKVAMDLPAPVLNVTDDTANQKLKVEWENKGAASYAYEVVVDGETVTPSQDIGLTTTLEIPYGDYALEKHELKVLVTANGNGEDKQTTEYRKVFFGFDSVPKNFAVSHGEIVTLTMPTASKGEITWKAEATKAISTGMEKDKVIAVETEGNTFTFPSDTDAIVRITWTLTVDGYSTDAYTYVFAQTAMFPLTDIYDDLYETATYTGDVAKSDVEIIDGQKSMRLFNGTGVVYGSFANNVYLGEHMKKFDYYLYNPTNSDIWVQITSVDNSFTVPARSIVKMNYVYWANAGYGWTAWKIVKSDGSLGDMNFTARSEGNSPVELYVGYFRVNDGAFDYGPIYVNGETTDTSATVSWKSVFGSVKYTYKVLVNGNEVVAETDIGLERSVSFDYAQYLADIVELEIVVTAYNANGESVTDSYRKSMLAFTSVPKNVYGIKAGDIYTVPMATANKGTVSWIAEEIKIDSRESLDTVLATWSSATSTEVKFTLNSVFAIRITYTVEFNGYQEKAYTYIYNGYYGGTKMTSLNGIYAGYVENSTVSGDMQKSEYDMLGDNGASFRLYNGTSTASGKITFPENTYVGDTRKAFSYYIYNASDSPVKITFPIGTSLTLPAKGIVSDFWALNSLGTLGYDSLYGNSWVNTYMNAKFELGTHSFKVESTGGVADVYIGGYCVNEDAFNLGELTIAGTRANKIATVSWEKVNGAVSYSYRVILDGNEIVASTPVTGETLSVSFDYSGYSTRNALVIEVTAYGYGSLSTTKQYKISFYSGTY